MIRKAFSFFVQLKKDSLFRHSSIMLVASVTAGALNYFYQIYIGRALKPEEYSVFGALFALFYILGILTGGMEVSTVKFTSKLRGEGKEINEFFQGLLKRGAVVGLFVFLLLLILTPSVAHLLKIKSYFLVIIVALSFPFASVLSANMGVLRGLEKFKLLGGYQVINTLVKFVSGIVLVAIGYGVLGALGALAIASVLILFASLFTLRSFLSPMVKTNPGFNYASFYKYTFSSLLFSFCFTIPANMDVILVKSFFPQYQAGLYTAASVLGKVLIFLPLGITAAMFPKVSRAQAENKPTLFLLKKALIYTGCLTGTVAVIYWFFPSYVVEIAFGLAYQKAFPLVRWYGLSMFFFSLSLVFLNYYLARHETKFIYIFAFLTVLEMILICLFHTSMLGIIGIILGINLAYITALFLKEFLSELYRRKRV